MTPRVKVWLQWLAGIYQASVHRRGSRVRRLLRVLMPDAHWPSLVLRLAAVSAGAIFVLIDPTASLVGAPTRADVSPVPSLIVLLLLALTGVVASMRSGRTLFGRPVTEAIFLVELLLVGVLVRVTSVRDSIFHLYFPLVVVWSTRDAGLWRGLGAGVLAAVVSLVFTAGDDEGGAILSSMFLLPLFGAVAAGQRAGGFAQALSHLQQDLAALARLRRFERTHSAVTAMASLPLDARIQRFLDEAVRLVDADVALVALVDDDGIPTVRGVHNLEKREWQTRRLGPDAGVTGRVLREGIAELTLDASRDAEWLEVFDGAGVGAAVAIPFRIQDRVIGLALLGRWNGTGFRPIDVETLTVLADEIAVVLHDRLVQEQLRDLLYSAVNTLTAALEAKDPYTRGHSQRVATSAAALAAELGLQSDQVERVRLASLLHDIGKIATPEAILRKHGPLTPEERAIINKHAERGAAMLGEMRPFRPLVDLVLYHQESFDGSGYPEGLAGEEIPLGARIIRVADTFDALISDRPYRRGKTLTQAVEELRHMAGTVLDPQVVERFLHVLVIKPPFDLQLRMWRERS